MAVSNLGTSTVTNLGGSSTYNASTGTVSAPSYKVNGNSCNDVGSAFSAVDGRLTYFDGRQNAQQATLDDHTARITQLEKWQGTTNSRLITLQQGIDSTGAMASALTQVQPKLTKKLRNQISTGIGFYRNTTAVALGFSHINAMGDQAVTASLSVSDCGDLLSPAQSPGFLSKRGAGDGTRFPAQERTHVIYVLPGKMALSRLSR